MVDHRRSVSTGNSESSDQATDANGTPEVRCPVCHCRHAPVIDVTPYRDKSRQKRKCRHCGKRFSTIISDSETDA